MSLKQHGHSATNGFVFPLFRQMLIDHSYCHISVCKQVYIYISVCVYVCVCMERWLVDGRAFRDAHKTKTIRFSSSRVLLLLLIFLNMINGQRQHDLRSNIKQAHQCKNPRCKDEGNYNQLISIKYINALIWNMYISPNPRDSGW